MLQSSMPLVLGMSAIGIAIAGAALQFNQLAARIARLERKLDQVLGHLGLSQSVGELSEQVRSLAEAGKKIEAIKLLRQETGMGLAEAKTAVEAWMETGQGQKA